MQHFNASCSTIALKEVRLICLYCNGSIQKSKNILTEKISQNFICRHKHEKEWQGELLIIEDLNSSQRKIIKVKNLVVDVN